MCYEYNKSPPDHGSDLLTPDAAVTCTDTHRADFYQDIHACDPSLQALQEVGHLLKKNTLSLNVRERERKKKQPNSHLHLPIARLTRWGFNKLIKAGSARV